MAQEKRVFWRTTSCFLTPHEPGREKCIPGGPPPRLRSHGGDGGGARGGGSRGEELRHPHRHVRREEAVQRVGEHQPVRRRPPGTGQDVLKRENHRDPGRGPRPGPQLHHMVTDVAHCSVKAFVQQRIVPLFRAMNAERHHKFERWTLKLERKKVQFCSVQLCLFATIYLGPV